MNKKRIIIVAAVAALLVLGLAAIMLLTQRSQDTSSLPVQSGTIQAEIKGMAYSPSALKIKKGTTVVWTNRDSIGHNVVADTQEASGGLPMSHALLNNGETFSFTFNQTGVIHYHCTPHPFMKGTIEVVE